MNRKRWPTALPILAGLLAIYLIAPFIVGLNQIGAGDWRSADVADLTQACLVSFASASLATLLVTLGGAPLGYLLARKPGRAMAAVGFLVQLPLALPPLTSGVLLLFLLGYASPLGRLTGGALTDSFVGIVLAEAFVSAPFLIIAARSAFAAADATLEDVAATLGHRPWAVFLRVSLPLAWRAIAAGMLLAWLRAFGEFGATVMVAYHPYSLPVFTYVAFGSEGLPAMAPILVPTLVVAVAVMLASQAFSQSRPKRSAAAAQAARPADEALARVEDHDLARPAKRRGAGALDFAFARRLDDFELNVAWRAQAARLAVLGASGSGKSMTLRLIAGLDSCEAQRISFAGRDLSACPPHARGIAYVPQNYGLLPHLAVAEQIRFSVGADEAAARRWSERLGLDALTARRPGELSLGQQQRVALARALSRRAGLILLDEPLSALDAPLRARLRQELFDLQEELEATTILVTHDPTEALLLADELMILEGGRALQVGSVESLFARPANETVARLLGAENISLGRALGAGAIDVGGGATLEVAGPPLSAGQAVGWAVKAERVKLCSDGRYRGRVMRVMEARAGQRALTLAWGDAVLEVVAEVGAGATDACLFDIDPGAVQVWTTSDNQRRIGERPRMAMSAATGAGDGASQ